jgi:putative membrane protein
MLLKENIPFGYVFGKIKYELIWITMYAVGIAIYHNFHITRISIPIAIPAILGTVISLLLGFRSNQAYERWWEARIIWGAVVNDSRNLTRQLLTFTNYAEETPPEVVRFREQFVRRQVAWSPRWRCCHLVRRPLSVTRCRQTTCRPSCPWRITVTCRWTIAVRTI